MERGRDFHRDKMKRCLNGRVAASEWIISVRHWDGCVISHSYLLSSNSSFKPCPTPSSILTHTTHCFHPLIYLSYLLPAPTSPIDSTPYYPFHVGFLYAHTDLPSIPPSRPLPIVFLSFSFSPDPLSHPDPPTGKGLAETIRGGGA